MAGEVVRLAAVDVALPGRTPGIGAAHERDGRDGEPPLAVRRQGQETAHLGEDEVPVQRRAGLRRPLRVEANTARSSSVIESGVVVDPQWSAIFGARSVWPGMLVVRVDQRTSQLPMSLDGTAPASTSRQILG